MFPFICSICIIEYIIHRCSTVDQARNFTHFLSQALDFLAIAVHELANISERRIERLCNPSLSNLPAFLVKDGGLNTGFMVVHCTAAALGHTTLHTYSILKNENDLQYKYTAFIKNKTL